MATVRPYPAPYGATDVNAMLQNDVVPGTRGTIFPAAQYTDGQYHLAWPGLIAQPFESFNAMSPQNSVEDNSRLAFDVAGGAMTGGLAAGMIGAAERQAARPALSEGIQEAVPAAERWQARPPQMSPIEQARNSRYWPEWGDDDPVRGMHAVQELEARSAWDNLVKPIQYPNGLRAMERWQAEAEAMKTNPELGHAYQAARRAGLENRKGRPLTKGEEVWESLDRPPGAPDATPEELMNTTAREKFMLAGHPDLSRKKLGNDIYANSPTGSSVPLAMSALERQPTKLTDLYHGTNARFGEFDPSKTDEMGFHFGSKEQANARSMAKNSMFSLPWPLGKGWRNMPVEIEANKIAELSRDPAKATGYSMAKQLVEDGIAPEALLDEASRLHVKQGKDAATAHVRSWLIDNGYDVVKYPNHYEGSGDPSYLALGTGNVKHAKTGRTLFANSPTGSSVPLAVNAMERKPGFTAYHGSPHDFDKFDGSKLGTGEGASAYGSGLYFADSEATAQSYRDALAPDGNGKMYEVNIAADPDQFIDWDKPLGEHPESVRNLVMPIAREEAERELRRRAYQQQRNDNHIRQLFGKEPKPRDPLPTADELAMRMWGNEFGPGYEQQLRDAGIPGIRYLDAGSREAGNGTYNYVVFDDGLVDINRKYANHPLGSSVPLAFNDYEDEPRNAMMRRY